MCIYNAIFIEFHYINSSVALSLQIFLLVSLGVQVVFNTLAIHKNALAFLTKINFMFHFPQFYFNISLGVYLIVADMLCHYFGHFLT